MNSHVMENQGLLSEFQSVCRTLLPPAKQEFLEKLFRKQMLLFETVDEQYSKSTELETILKGHLENLKSSENKEKEVFKNIWDLNQSLKGHKRVKVEVVQNGTDNKASKKDDGESTAPSTSTEDITAAGSEVEVRVEGEALKNDKEVAKNDKDQRRIEKLERKLEKLHRAIQKLSERELTLDEMEESCSTHMQEHKLRMRFVKGWELLCRLKKTSTATGRAKESRLSYRNSNYPEINARITKLMNKPDYFPDYHDVLNLITKVNAKYQLGIDEMETGLMAREIFVDIGKELKRRRQQDLIQSFGYASFSAASHDPAEESEELRMKLKQNKEESSKKLTEAIDKFSQEQRIREARGEDLEAASEDEEEVPEDGEVSVNVDGQDDVKDALSDEDEPPAKKQKTEDPCKDGANCGTDSELSDQHEAEGKDHKSPVLPEANEVKTETEGTDVDNFLMTDDTATILTSEDEGTTTIGKAVCLDESDLSSVTSVVSLSDDDHFGDERMMSSEEEDQASISPVAGNIGGTGENNHSVKSESSDQNRNGFHLHGKEPSNSGPEKFFQVAFSCSDGKEDSNESRKLQGQETLPRTPNGVGLACDGEKLPSGEALENDPIDSLGDEGLVPVVQCHAYAFVGNSGSHHSVGTMAVVPPQAESGVQPSSVSSSDCIEILDSSSPSPSIEDTERGTAEPKPGEPDVIFISDSE